jgi:hypothetical protein
VKRRAAAYVPTDGLSMLSCIFLFMCSGYVVLVNFVGLVTRPSLVLNERLNMLSKSMDEACRDLIVERMNCRWEE